MSCALQHQQLQAPALGTDAYRHGDRLITSHKHTNCATGISNWTRVAQVASVHCRNVRLHETGMML
jgi:hypothetical protein